MKKLRLIIIIIVTVAIFCGIFAFLTLLVSPKYMSDSKEGAMIGEYYDDEKGNDVIFIGDCEVYENISPITLYEEYGITSYIRGSAQQLMWHSYYILEETLEYETPRVVVFNVLAMMYGSNEDTGDLNNREAYNRMTFDTMRWSKYKWQAITASMTDDEKDAGGIWTYIFPLLRYHDRITSLEDDDFKYLFYKDKVTDNGYLMQTGVKPVTGDYVEPPRADYTFADICYEYLDKIVELCEENGIQLILMKAPSLSPVWFDEWDEQIVSYAEEKGLYYVNFLNYQEEIGIDWQTDTYDAGLHLNVYGAEKLASYLGGILKEQCDLEDHRNDPVIDEIWQAKIKAYNERKAEKEAEGD